MAEGTDIGWIALGIAVVVLFAWYAWHVATSVVHYARTMTEFLDTRSERQRRRLDFESVHGRPPLWYRLVQKILIFVVIAGAAALVWTKFRSA